MKFFSLFKELFKSYDFMEYSGYTGVKTYVNKLFLKKTFVFWNLLRFYEFDEIFLKKQNLLLYDKKLKSNFSKKFFFFFRHFLG